MCLAWGEGLISLYNDAFRAVLGTKPDGLGRPLAELWGDAWAAIGPMVTRALAGEACYVEDFPLILDRRGHLEHTWWTCSYSPAFDETGQIRGVLCVAHETTQDVQARAALPAQRERLARLFDQAPGFIAYLSGPNHVYELTNQPQLHHDLIPDRDLLGKTVREAFPDLDGQGFADRLDEVYKSGKTRVARAERIVLAGPAGPCEHYIDHVYHPVTDDDGAVIGVFVIGHDVTEQVLAGKALREREERFRLAVDAGRMAVWDVDLESAQVTASPELNRMLGFPPDASPSLAELHRHYYPGELDRVRMLNAQALERGDRFFEAEYRYIRPDTGETRWLSLRAMRELSREGEARRSFGVLLDVTERKEAEERLKLLALEVDHRANNLLATVQSVVSLTRADDVPDFRENVLGRINALAQAHRLLAEKRWAAAGLARVVEEELRPFMSGNRVNVEGPDANLAPAVAQGLAIALHELVTNAVKHGALSTREGRIALTWAPPGKDGLVRMTWLERGGPPVQAPSRSGFGTNLLRRAFGGAIKGVVELDWQAEGLCCRLVVPVL